MADLKISQLNTITTLTPATDVLPVVDVNGVTKKITTNQILGSGGTATLASATITGDLTVDTSTLKVDSANNRVGIGTASPSETLHVSGGASDGVLKLSNTASGNAVIVSRTTGEMDVLNAANSSLRFWTNTVTRYTIDNTGVSTWSVGGSTAMTLNSTGLGIGVTPSAWESTFKAIQINNRGAYISATSNSFSTAPFVQIGNNGYYDATNSRWEYVTANAAAQYVQAANSHLWYTAAVGSADAAITDFATAKMTLDASGNLYLKTTSRLSSGVFSVAYVPGTSQGAVFQPNVDTSSPTPIQFLNSSGSGVGSITTTASATAYNINSDYRLKEAVQPLSGGLARVSALKPSIYKWKVDGSNGEGFLAHELAEVVPFAVTGEKDAVNEDGSIKTQGVDLSKIVPILVAAIQELAAEVNALKNA